MMKSACFLFYFAAQLAVWKRWYSRQSAWWVALWSTVGLLWILLRPPGLQMAAGLGISLCLMAVFFQDLQTYYFDGRWLAAAAWILFCSLAFSAVPVNSRLLGLVFGAAALIMALCRKMGSADVVFLGVMGWVLGLERMEAAMLISCILGLLWFALQRPKEKIVPFCCCLSLGLEAGLLFGYRLASLF